MSGSPSTLASLRQLVADRFPSKARKAGGRVPTGVPALDEPLGGGLPAGLLTELVSAAPSSGGQLVLAGLLASTRAARQRMGLIDGADSLDPQAMPFDDLRHLVWARCAGVEQAVSAADILVRDGNYAAIVLDLRGLPERALLRLPAAVWYRLQRAAEGGCPAVLVQTAFPLVPAVPARFLLKAPLPLSASRLARSEIAVRLPAIPARGHAEGAQEDIKTA